MPNLNRTSFQTKLNRVIGFSLVISLLILSITVNIIERKYSREALVEELEVISDIVVDNSIASLLFFDIERAERNLDSTKHHNSIDALCLYDSNHAIFSRYERDKKVKCEAEMPEFFAGSAEVEVNAPDATKVVYFNGRIILVNGINEAGRSLGHLVLYANETALISEQLRLTSILIIVFSLTLIATYLFTRGLLSGLLKPLNLLLLTARKISQKGNIGERAERLSNDEVGDLVDAFNHMLESIEVENEAVFQSESRFRTLAENAPIGIYLKDKNNVPLYVNEKWRQITGFNQEYSHASYLASIVEGDVLRYENFLENSLQSMKTQMLEYRFRKAGEHSDSVLMEYITPVIVNRSRQEGEQLSGYIGSLVDVTELKVAQMELEKLAYYDPLTNLPNRRYFRDHLEKELSQAQESDNAVAVALVDLDNFKRVNDSLGHDAGDILLSVLADRLRQRLNKNDIVARMGGDEFYIVLKDLHDIETIDSITRRILDALSQPIRIKNHFVEITASIGLAIYPHHAQIPEELIRNADIALYKAKEQGKNRVAWFSGDMEAIVREKMHLESRLRQAVFNSELEIYIQPQFDTNTHSWGWGEVLLRWNDLDEGFIPPDKFIPVAEETGIISYIDEWVLRASCQLLRDHGTELEALGIKGLSVNMSAKQFYSRAMIEAVKRAFNDFGVSPSKISFELTESMIIEDINLAISTMEELRRLGCSISLDDFGTGYSSLSYLKKLPLDNLKIDRSFISDIPGDSNDVAITEAIIAMAEKLNISIVAEGIETEEQRDFLIANKCYRMQGYFFAKPMPIEQLLQLTVNRADSQTG